MNDLQFSSLFLVVAGLCLTGCGAQQRPAASLSTSTATSEQASPTASTGMSTWSNALSSCRTHTLDVVVLGDSRSIVDTTFAPETLGIAATFGSKWTDLLVQQLKVHCGSHGTGLVPLLAAVNSSNVNADYYTLQGAWTGDSAIGPSQGGNLPGSLVLKTTAPTTIAFTAHQAFDQVNVYCAAGPGLGSWDLLIDGSPAGTCGSAASTLSAVLSRSPLVTPGQHSVTLACTAVCEIYGVEVTVGVTGVSVHNLSVGSCTAECFGSDPASQLAFVDLIPRQSQLTIINLLTNEPGVAYSTTSFQNSLSNLISHARSSPGNSSVLIISPLQDGLQGQAPYYPVLADTALQESTAFLDMRATYGNDLVPSLFGPDMNHENDQGQAAVYTGVSALMMPQ
jgi:hypothetical protein